ncbi:MAG: sigma-54 dependent transcriptional regulator [Pseudomonadota bacterium]
MSARILVVDDDRGMCELLHASLKKRGYEIRDHLDAAAALRDLEAEDFDVVVTDLNMRGMNGIELCQKISENRPNTPVIVITAFGSLETAVAAIRAGAYDFVQKPLEIDALVLVLERAIQHRTLREEVRRLRQTVQRYTEPEIMLGASEPMSKLLQMIEKVSQGDPTVLIYGETGSGKELVARRIHQSGMRSREPFIAVNCAAMPATLLESEMFGHVRGAFTDARSDRNGLFVQAHRGVLFLDEVGELPMELQPKLLRALQERKVRPVGSDREVPFDVQIIASTNRDLEQEVEEGRFRKDLFFRIHVVSIFVPPLRMRGNDILLLAQHFLGQFAAKSKRPVDGISTPAAEKLLAYDWPGNVRELQNCIERAVALTSFQSIVVGDLPEAVSEPKHSASALRTSDPGEILPIQEMERRHILNVMERLGGNRTVAAKALGLDRKTLYRKLKAFGID